MHSPYEGKVDSKGLSKPLTVPSRPWPRLCTFLGNEGRSDDPRGGPTAAGRSLPLRDIYAKAADRVQVRMASGHTVVSDIVSRCWGSMQGDCLSPLIFCIILHVFERYVLFFTTETAPPRPLGPKGEVYFVSAGKIWYFGFAS